MTSINYMKTKSLKILEENNDLLTMAIIHCGFVPHQNKVILTQLISQRNNPADDSTTKS